MLLVAVFMFKHAMIGNSIRMSELIWFLLSPVSHVVKDNGHSLTNSDRLMQILVLRLSTPQKTD